MEPEKIGQIWAAHYSDRGSDPGSGQICSLICLMLRQRAVLEIEAGNFAVRLARALAAAGIPIEQFDACEAEIK